MKCIVCNDEKLQPVGSNPSFLEGNVYQCSQCQFALTYPLPTSTQLTEFYQSGFYIRDTNLTGLEQRLRFSEQRALSQFEFMENLLPSPTKSLKALELGCSEGSLLLLLEKYGFNVVGYEPDTKMAKLANERLVNKENKVINKIFKEEDLGAEDYNLICSSHVFEHLTNPIAHLHAVKKALKEDGLLFLEIPNQYALENFVGANAKKNGHLYCYSPKSIEKLLLANGFKVISLKTCGKSAKEVRRKNAQQVPKLEKKTLLKKITNKLKQKLARRSDLPKQQKKEQNPFMIYWDDNQEQGQWIRLVASPVE